MQRRRSGPGWAPEGVLATGPLHSGRSGGTGHSVPRGSGRRRAPRAPSGWSLLWLRTAWLRTAAHARPFPSPLIADGSAARAATTMPVGGGLSPPRRSRGGTSCTSCRSRTSRGRCGPAPRGARAARSGRRRACRRRARRRDASAARRRRGSRADPPPGRPAPRSRRSRGRRRRPRRPPRSADSSPVSSRRRFIFPSSASVHSVSRSARAHPISQPAAFPAPLGSASSTAHASQSARRGSTSSGSPHSQMSSEAQPRVLDSVVARSASRMRGCDFGPRREELDQAEALVRVHRIRRPRRGTSPRRPRPRRPRARRARHPSSPRRRPCAPPREPARRRPSGTGNPAKRVGRPRRRVPVADGTLDRQVVVVDDRHEPRDRLGRGARARVDQPRRCVLTAEQQAEPVGRRPRRALGAEGLEHGEDLVAVVGRGGR